MPLYYFHITNGKRAFRDPEGVELSDLRAAHDYALEDARDLIRRNSFGHEALADWTFEITDVCGRYVLTVPFAEAEDDGIGRDARAA